jgi:uncharacterized cupredoxin-like copper-binding protein
MKRAFGLAACCAVIAGCGGEDTSESASPLAVEGNEYAFVMPSEGEAGVVRFDVSNEGEELHEFALGRIDDGKTAADVEAFLKSGAEGTPSWFTDMAGVPLLSPGNEVSITRDLPAGRYVFLCFLPSPKGVPHISLGMLKEFELTGDSGATLPDAHAVITASADGFDVPELEAGEQTIELRNAGTREREFFLFALHEGKTMADIDRYFEHGEDKAASPADFHGAMQTIPAGTSVFLDIDLEPDVATFTPSG